MRVEWFTDDSAFDQLKPEWNDLLHRSVTDTLFLTWEWQTTWWQCLGSGTPCIITVREDDGTLIGLLPLFWDSAPDGPPAAPDGPPSAPDGLPAAPNGSSAELDGPTRGSNSSPATLSLIGCVDVSDYLDGMVARGHEEIVYPAFADALTHPNLPRWDHIQLCTLPAASPTNVRFKEEMQARGFQVEWRVHDVSPLIELPATFEDYLAILDKKQRHEIRRKLRRIEEVLGRWYAVQSGADLDAAVADFIELHKKSQPNKHLFMDDRMRQFFIQMARTCSAQGWLQLEFLEIGGERAAAVINLIYQNEVLVYNSGYNPDKYANIGPGMALFALSIQQAIAASRRVYDFLRGDEEYKYRFGAKNTNVYELHVRRESPVVSRQ
jgi:CelD/BcsL family acetyltransferase involved in cellulose biosynthesis